MYKIFIIFAILCGLSLYIPLSHGFFIQDEWIVFSKFVLLKDESSNTTLSYLLFPQPGQYVPVTSVATWLAYTLFKLNYTGYFILGIFFHGLIAFLISYLAFLLTKKKLISIFSALLFVVSPIPFQGTTWPVANIGYTLCALFYVGGLIFLVRYIKISKNLYIFLSSLSFSLSFLSKQIVPHVILIAPLFLYLIKGRTRFSFNTFLIGLPVLLLTMWSYIMIKLHPVNALSIPETMGIHSIATLPLRAVAESFVPLDFINFISTIVMAFIPLSKNNADLIILLCLFMVLIGAIYFVYRRKKYQAQCTLIISLLLVSAFSGLAYAFVDGSVLLQPRYLYIATISTSIAIAIGMDLLLQINKRIGILLCFIIFLSYSSVTLKNSVELANIGNQRQMIFNTIVDSIPDNGKKIIIYTDSNTSYYGMPANEKMLPFQHGLGQAIADALYEKQNPSIPEQILKEETLWPILSQGYYQAENGFGYFRDYKLMKETIKTYNLSPESVISYSWNSRTNKLQNITNEVRSKLKKDLDEEKK